MKTTRIMLTMGVIIAIATTQSNADQGKLRYIVDGDTVQLSDTTCRLAYIDTPESKPNAKAKRDISGSREVILEDVVTAGRMAKNYLQSIMNKGEVYEYDVTTVDHYGRSVCVIYSNNTNGTINNKIVENGFAVPFWKYLPKNMRQKMAELVGFAEQNNKGLWRTSRNVMELMNGDNGTPSGGYMEKAGSYFRGLTTKNQYQQEKNYRHGGYDYEQYESEDNDYEPRSVIEVVMNRKKRPY